MTLCACIIPSAYDFTFALPSAFYEPILALLCQCYKPHRLSSAYLIYTNTSRYNSIPSRHDSLLHLRTGLPFLSFTTQFCSIGFLCFSAPLLFLGITNHCRCRPPPAHSVPSLRLSRPFLAVAPLLNSIPRRYPSSRISAIAFCISPIGR